MNLKEASVISVCVIVFLTLTGLVKAIPRKPPCNKTRFDAAVYNDCVPVFNITMTTTDYQLKCPWPTARQSYINLMNCIERCGNKTGCTQISFRHKILLEIHQIYFSLCSRLKDPDIHVVLLFIIPCVSITFMTPLLFHKFRLHEKKQPNDTY